MHTFLTFIKEFRFPTKEELRDAVASFNRKKLFAFITILVVAFVSMVVMLQKINASFMVTVPSDGGTLTEGIIGIPTLVNPVLAVSDADKDVTALVYSGLMRKVSDGTFIPDLAESYTVSPDGMTYTFTIKKSATFHDGTPVTADDVLFTITKIQDPMIKSPRKLSWDGVTIEKKEGNVIVFSLKQPYISFMDNTTIGILPIHIWKNVSESEFSVSPLNIKAIGSGPYQIDKVARNNDGIPVSYTLKRFTDFVLGSPHIKNLTIISYANEKDIVQDLLNHSIDQAGGLSPENALNIKKSGYTIHTATLARIFGIFWNNAHNKIFSDPAVVQAFDKATDRRVIVDTVLGGYGTPIHSPIPESILGDKDMSATTASLDEARSILDKAGWTLGADGVRVRGGIKTVTQTKKVGKKTVTQNVTVDTGPLTKLVFSLTTGNTPELKQTSILIKEQLESIGAHVDIKYFETGPLNQLIRERSYEALFFGQVINHESDLYSFWHSSQKNDPGLNIAMYSSKTVDTILESVQKISDKDTRIASYQNFVNEFNKDIPALLIYSPSYVYATSSKLNNISFDTITVPSDRFLSVYTWYASVDHVWKIFTTIPATGTDK